MMLLERDAELATLQAHLAQVRTGRGCFVLITGEAGIGKTALVRTFGRGLPKGTALLTGACDPLSTPSAHAPLLDLEDALGSAVRDLLRDRAEPSLLFSAVLDALRTLPGAILVIEDIHWADDGTVDLLRFLSRRIERLPVLIIATVRSDDQLANNQLRPFLGELARTPGYVRIALSPLSRAAVEAMVGDRPIPVDVLLKRTAGNPFFVTELLATGVELPPSVNDAVLGRLARLSPRGRHVVQIMAMLGPGVPLAAVGAVAGTDIANEVEEAIAGGVLSATTEGLGFRHELAREAIFESITPVRRQELYRTIVRVMATCQPDHDPAWMAHYATGAADRHAIRIYSTQAAERAAALGANREAALHYRRALAAAEDQSDGIRIPLMLAYATVTSNTGWTAENLRVRSELIDYFRAHGDIHAEVDQLRELTMSHFNAGRNSDGEDAIRQALALLERLPESGTHAQVYATRAMTFMLDRKSREAIDWGNRSMRLAEAHHDPSTAIRAQNAIGSALIVSGNLSEGVSVLEAAVAAARARGHQAVVVNLLSNLGSASGEMYELATAETALLQTIDEARSADLDGPLSYALSWLALVRLYQGRWSESTQLAQEALAIPFGITIGHIMALVAIGRIRARRGDPGVWDALDEALALAGPTGTLQRIAPVAGARAEARWLEGDADSAIHEALRGYELAVQHEHSWHAGELSYWLRLAGADRAQLFEVAPPWRLQSSGNARAAASAWSAHGCVYESARALLESLHIEDIQSAWRTFGQLGAAPMTARAAQRLRELGGTPIPRGPRRATRQNAAGLTPREMEVLRLLATGSTYAEIGDALFISGRTVEHHVSSIVRKLGVRGRRDAVRAAAERHLLSD